jgi:hypothetical protein
VDDCLICSEKTSVIHAKEEMKKQFDCDEVVELAEYVGCKIDHNKEEGWIKLTQPILMQSYVDEFDLPKGELPRTPATPGSVLKKGRSKGLVARLIAIKIQIGRWKTVTYDEMDETRNLKCSTRAESIYGSRKFGAFKRNVPRNEVLWWYTK